jgi:hypothetical protein
LFTTPDPDDARIPLHKTEQSEPNYIPSIIYLFELQQLRSYKSFLSHALASQKVLVGH